MVCKAVADLNREWMDLSASRSDAVTDRLTDWAVRCAALAAVSDLGQVLAAVKESPDLVLHFLVGAGQAGDELAVRTVMQAMLGGVLRGCRNLEEQAVALSYLWEAVVSYPLDRRPQRIASNLKLDTIKHARADGKTDLDREFSTDPEDISSLVEATAHRHRFEWTAQNLIEAIRETGAVSPSVIPLLQAVVVADRGNTGDAVAAALNISPAAGRQRLRHAVTVLREHRRELVEVAA